MTTNNINNNSSDITISSININGGIISTLSNLNLNLLPNGIGKVIFSNAYKFPSIDGTENQVLRTDGAGQLFFSNNSYVNIFVFFSSGTYTPSSGLVSAVVELIGAGGGSGGCLATNSTTICNAGGGGGGGYAQKKLSAVAIGASQTITIGNGGTAGTSLVSGGNGQSTLFGSIFSATGGTGGAYGPNALTKLDTAGGPPGIGVGGDVNITGTAGKDGTGFYYSPGVTYFSIGGDGGGSYFSPYKSVSRSTLQGNDGVAGNLYGGGAVGAYNYISGLTRVGAIGGKGIAIITEFLQ